MTLSDEAEVAASRRKQVLDVSAGLAATLGPAETERTEGIGSALPAEAGRAVLLERIAAMRNLAAGRDEMPQWAEELAIFRTPGFRRVALRAYNVLARDLYSFAGMAADALEVLAFEIFGDEPDDD